eukprot:CAMPEP_0196571922 /NCGR_PEP_ID=MMETSP1081-20130531/2059_1 /TAXON_ID=36882 /ORGANISM="Pyramimonas amylifera, Strain CCMP720" /LENGTH=589 /DNA_ID=CAMNT_0041889063 /DNA_START=103 /DNA_END=1872 /DNA_ORIENTATION=-
MNFAGLWNKVSEVAAESAHRAQELAAEGAARASKLAEDGRQIAAEASAAAIEQYSEASTVASARIAAIAQEVKEKGATQVFLENTQDARKNLTELIANQSRSHGEQLPDVDELMYFGISPDILDFVAGLTVQTFRDFPNIGEEQEVKLTDWQTSHCKYMLLICQELTDFRYVLVPRRMTDERFWKVYFILVSNQLEKELEKQSMLVDEEIRAEDDVLAAKEEKAAVEDDFEDVNLDQADNCGNIDDDDEDCYAPIDDIPEAKPSAPTPPSPALQTKAQLSKPYTQTKHPKQNEQPKELKTPSHPAPHKKAHSSTSSQPKEVSTPPSAPPPMEAEVVQPVKKAEPALVIPSESPAAEADLSKDSGSSGKNKKKNKGKKGKNSQQETALKVESAPTPVPAVIAPAVALAPDTSSTTSVTEGTAERPGASGSKTRDVEETSSKVVELSGESNMKSASDNRSSTEAGGRVEGVANEDLSQGVEKEGKKSAKAAGRKAPSSTPEQESVESEVGSGGSGVLVEKDTEADENEEDTDAGMGDDELDAYIKEALGNDDGAADDYDFDDEDGGDEIDMKEFDEIMNSELFAEENEDAD